MEEVRPFHSSSRTRKAPLFSFFLIRGKASLNRPPRLVLRSPTEVAAVLFTSNLVGVLFARSLHYQFQSWYFYQLPFFVCLSPLPEVSAYVPIPSRSTFSCFSPHATRKGLTDTSSGCEQVAAGTCRVRMVNLPVD